LPDATSAATLSLQERKELRNPKPALPDGAGQVLALRNRQIERGLLRRPEDALQELQEPLRADVGLLCLLLPDAKAAEQTAEVRLSGLAGQHAEGLRGLVPQVKEVAEGFTAHDSIAGAKAPALLVREGDVTLELRAGAGQHAFEDRARGLQRPHLWRRLVQELADPAHALALEVGLWRPQLAKEVADALAAGLK